MTARAEYTRDEWTLLHTAPQAAIMAVIFSDGVGVVEPLAEAVAALAEQIQGPRKFEHNELIAALMTNKESIEPANLPQPQGWDETPDQVFKRLRHQAIHQSRAAMQLLTERTNEREATGYAEWVLSAAKAAAVARQHRKGFFGSSQPVVDEAECAMLGEIAEALGIPVGELPADAVCAVVLEPESPAAASPEPEGAASDAANPVEPV